MFFVKGEEYATSDVLSLINIAIMWDANRDATRTQIMTAQDDIIIEHY